MLASSQSSASSEELATSQPVRREDTWDSIRRIVESNSDELIVLMYAKACEELRDAKIAYHTAAAIYDCAAQQIRAYKSLIDKLDRTAGSEKSKSGAVSDPGEAKP